MRNSHVPSLATFCNSGLDKEAQELKREEAKLRRDIKVELKKGNQSTAKQMAKSLVRLQAQQTKLQAGKDRINGVGTSLRVGTSTLSFLSSIQVAYSIGPAIAWIGVNGDCVGQGCYARAPGGIHLACTLSVCVCVMNVL